MLPLRSRFALVLLVSTLTFATAQDPSPYSLARSGVAAGRVEKTKLFGRSTSSPFQETNIKGGILIGFDLALSRWFDTEVVTGILPVYRNANGLSYGREYGRLNGITYDGKRKSREKPPRVVQVRARAGHAIGGVRLRTGLGLDGLAVSYHRIQGQALEPTPAYRSEFIGNLRGGSESSFTGNGQPIVGVFGNMDENRKVVSLGFVLLKTNPAATEVAPVIVAKPAPARPAPPAVAAAEPKQADPAAKEPDLAPPPAGVRAEDLPAPKFSDAQLRYALELPDGWRSMPDDEIRRVNAFVEQRFPGRNIRYDGGFRLVGSRLGSFPYVLIQTHRIPTAGMTYAQIERQINTGLDAPLKEVQGEMKDLLGDLTLGTPFLDRANDRIVMRVQMDSPNGKVVSLNVSHLGARSIVSVHSYCREDTFARHLPMFTRLNDSFAFDEGFRFVPPGASNPAEETPNAVATWIPLAVFAGVSGVLLLPLMFLYGKKKPLPRKPREDKAEHDKSHKTPTEGTTVLMTNALLSGLASRPESHGPPPFFTVLRQNVWKANRLYRIYVLSDELLFLEAGPGDGKGAVSTGVGTGGIIGALVGHMIAKRMQEQTKSRQYELDIADLEGLRQEARQGPQNFRMCVEDVAEAKCEAPGFWGALFNTCQGKVRIREHGDKPCSFQFEKVEEMQKGIELLSDALGDMFEVNALLDRRSWRYVRKS